MNPSTRSNKLRKEQCEKTRPDDLHHRRTVFQWHCHRHVEQWQAGSLGERPRISADCARGALGRRDLSASDARRIAAEIAALAEQGLAYSFAQGIGTRPDQVHQEALVAGLR